MRQDLNVGNVVDDGTGDYLRKGGLKINDNFKELYFELGDGDTPYSAGAWKTHKASDSTKITGAWGKSYVIDTSSARVSLMLPKGTVQDYNKVIRARDVFATWSTNPVTLIPAIGDTIKGDAVSKEINTQFADLELVYCPPGRWEYIDNKQINKITSGNQSAVIRKEYLVETQDQTDFLDIFDGHDYNKQNIEVFHRGNILYYGTAFTANSDFGSPGKTPTELVAMNGRDIRLRQKCNVGDTVIIISYLDGVTQWHSTYNRRQIVLLDEKRTSNKSVEGAVFVTDLSTTRTFPVSAFGLSTHEPINPNSLEVEFNGITQAEQGTLNTPLAYCKGADADSFDGCTLLGGTWVDGDFDYIAETNDDNRITGFTTGRKMEHGDVITIKWYNNNIGTVMELEDIIDETDSLYIAQGTPISLTGEVAITDISDINNPKIEQLPARDVTLNSPSALFDIFHPVGTVYENRVNPNNPATYMGFGKWIIWGEGLVTAGWSSDVSDADFALNNNDLDVNGNPSHTAGGTLGTRKVEIQNGNLPATLTDDKVLISDPNGPIVVGGCQFDPDEQGPAYTKYREAQATTNKSHVTVQALNNIQPTVTVYRWLRIE